MTKAEHLVSAPARRASLAFVPPLVNLAIAAPLAFALNIWQDEAYTLQTTSRGLGYAFHQALAFEQSAPLYFVLLTLWRYAGDGLFWLRLFSVLCAAGAVALVPALARRYVPRANGLLIAVVVACNPFVIWAAIDMRAYAMIVLLSALLMLLYYDAFAQERPSPALVVAYAVCVAAALYTQYYLAFLVAGQGVATLLFYRRSLLRFVLAAGAGVLAFVPLLAALPGQVQNFKEGFVAPSLPHTVATLGNIFMRYMVPLPTSHAKLFYAALIVLAVVALAIFRPRLQMRGDGAVVAITLAAFAFFAVGTYALGVHVLERHAASLLIPSALSVFAALTWLPAAGRDRTLVAWATAIVVLSLAVLVQSYAGLANPGDWARVNAYVRAHEAPGEPIVVFEAENALPFSYYYAGPNRVVAIPHAVDFRRYDVTQFIIHGPAELRSTMPRASRLWLVTAGGCTSDNVSFGCGTLERFVGDHYGVVSDRIFRGSRVRLLVRRKEAPLVQNREN